MLSSGVVAGVVSTEGIEGLDLILQPQELPALQGQRDVAVLPHEVVELAQREGIAAREVGVATVGFTGRTENAMTAQCDLVLRAPCDETDLIQQVHIVAAHAICGMVEQAINEVRAGIAYCESVRDFGSRDLLQKILEREEENVDFLERQRYRLGNMADDGFHVVAEMAAGAGIDRERDNRAAARHSASMRSAAARGSAAAMIGRPTTR